MKRGQKCFFAMGRAFSLVASVWMTSCLATEEPDYEVTFTIEAGELSLQEYDRSAAGLQSAGGGSYCEAFCDCLEDLYDYDYDECMSNQADSEEQCYVWWMDLCGDEDDSGSYYEYGYSS